LPEIVLKNSREFVSAAAVSAGAAPNGTSLKDALKDPERKIILDALAKCGWNKKETAELLGINRTTLYKKLAQYGIDPSPKKS
jgi:DNA-binding NtrC family response regulator